MTAVPFPNLKKQDLTDEIKQAIFHQVKRSIPTGFNSNKNPDLEGNRKLKEFSLQHPPSKWLQKTISQKEKDRVESQIGTLGGGNHFIELLYDENESVWVMLHSGSRYIGKTTAEYHHKIAHAQYGKLLSKGNFPPADLAALEIDSPEGQEYLNDMLWCQQYAHLNREIMLNRLIETVVNATHAEPDYSKRINIHHNFCEKRVCSYLDTKTGKMVENKELWVTRKGATSARLNEYGIIPGSMGVGSYIVKGRGSNLSWQSCSHGAGRKLSRTKAKNLITFEEFTKDMKGILYEKTPKLLDEAPGAYKPLEQVMKDQEMLVEVVHRLLPLVNVKGF
jgi:tRNA-splicing ligase RtcB